MVSVANVCCAERLVGCLLGGAKENTASLVCVKLNKCPDVISGGFLCLCPSPEWLCDACCKMDGACVISRGSGREEALGPWHWCWFLHI